jgi:hypothetical protein
LILVLSAPAWALPGSGFTSVADRAAVVRYPKLPWEELRKGARFPQGLPAGLTPAALKPAPRGSQP